MDIVSFLFTVLITIILKIVSLILIPIDAFIAEAVPSLDIALSTVGQFLTLVGQGLGWAISASGIPFSVISLIGMYMIFKLTLPINIWLVKLALDWYKKLK